MTDERNDSYRILGRVFSRGDARPVAGVRVEAWDKDRVHNDLVGSAVTDEHGAFEVTFDERYFRERFGDARPDLYFRVFLARYVLNTEDSVLWNVGAGDVPVSISVDAESLRRVTAPASLEGRVVNQQTGYPAPNLQVRAVARDYIREADARPVEDVLGNATTDGEGWFQIEFATSQRAGRLLDMWTTGVGGVSIVLTVGLADGDPFYTSDAIPPNQHAASRRLNVVLPAPPIDHSAWRALGAKLEGARVVQVHLVARGLMDSESALFADWDWPTRHAVFSQLEREFLDPQGVLRGYGPVPGFRQMQDPAEVHQYISRVEPHLDAPGVREALTRLLGKVRTFGDLQAVDWPLDAGVIAGGHVGEGLTTFEGNYATKPGDAIIDFGGIVEKSSLARYRDYLREILLEGPNGIDAGDPRPSALSQLTYRFHQRFTGYDETLQPANEVVINVVRSVLITARPGGFAAPLGSIAPRGARTSRQYLDYLIGLTGLRGDEFTKRFRIDVSRPDTAMSSEVQENITTLQNILRDGFQSDPDPFAANPPHVVDTASPYIYTSLYFKAPFFLWYDEWLNLEKKLWAENIYQLRQLLRINVLPEHFETLKRIARLPVPGQPDVAPTTDDLLQARWLLRAMDMLAKVDEGLDRFSQNVYGEARAKMIEAAVIATSLITDPLWPVKATADTVTSYVNRRNTPANTLKEFRHLLAHFVFDVKPNTWVGVPLGTKDIAAFRLSFWLFHAFPQLQAGVAFFAGLAIPTWLGDIAIAQGDHDQAIKIYMTTSQFIVGVSRTDALEGWAAGDDLITDGVTPYTIGLGSSLDRVNGTIYRGIDSASERGIPQAIIDYQFYLAAGGGSVYLHRVDKALVQLRQGLGMLEWADALYRTDDPTNMARARELYKGVLRVHGEFADISPAAWWGLGGVPGAMFPGFKSHEQNPAMVQQTTRARLALYQLDASLNYYGSNDSLVPLLRFRTLYSAAERFAALAKSTQDDFLFTTGRMEEALIERRKSDATLQKGLLQVQAAVEQIANAQHQVTVANDQVAAVQAAIAAKETEINDANSLWGQLGSYASGMIDVATGGNVPGLKKPLPEDTRGSIGSGVATAFTGKELVGEGFLGLGVAGSAFGGAGLWLVASYLVVQDMEAAASKRKTELSDLVNKALPAAQAVVEARKRDVHISNLMRQIAQADVDLTRDLLRFQSTRTLTVEFWASVASIMKRVMRRSIDLGARFAWLAERALAYEMDRLFNIIKFDYFPMALQGVTGVDVLRSDLAELEAARLDGLRPSVPARHTFSLIRDFPLQFGELKATGGCTFRTDELALHYAYPGTYGYRIRAVTLAINSGAITDPIRGLLTNQGISWISRADGHGRISIRPPEAFPLSEFRLAGDMAVYGLPDEALMTFEGSGVDTFWKLELPSLANPYGLNSLTDVLLTIDTRTFFSPTLHATHLATRPATVRRSVFISSLRHEPERISDLIGAAPTATFTFHPTRIGLSQSETNRKLKNVVLMTASDPALTFDATLRTNTTANPINVKLIKGVAISNTPPTGVPAPGTPSPLNVLTDTALEDTFQLQISKAANAGVDFSGVVDVLLGIEYVADLQP
jgi:hypothetical protein